MKTRLDEVKKEILDDQNVAQNLDWLRTNLGDFGLDEAMRKKFEAAIDQLAESYRQSKGTDFFKTMLDSTFRDLMLVVNEEKL